jgi:hypothetical protein
MFCPMCGAPNEDDALFCGNCGAVLDPDQPLEETPAKEVPQAEVSEAEISEVEGVDETFEPALEGAEEHPEEEAEVPLDEPLSVPSPPPPPPPPRPAPAPGRSVQTSGMAIASLVMGIAGWTVLPLIGSVLAIIFGYMARNDIRQRPDELEGDGLALAGLVLGWIAVGLSVLLLCLGGLGMFFFFSVIGTAGY